MSGVNAIHMPKLRFPGFSGEWQLKKIGDISTKVGSGSTPKGGSAVYLTQGVPFIRSQNVNDNRLIMDDVVYISEATHKQMSGTHIMPGDVLLNLTGASMGRSCVVPNDFVDGNLNQHVCIIRLKNNSSPVFVQTQLSKSKVQNRLREIQTGGGKEGLNFQAVRSIAVALPSDEEQQKIAEFLTAVDDRIGLSERRLELLKKCKQGVMQKVFTQQVRFKDSNGKPYPKWEEKELGDLFDRVTTKNKGNNQSVLTISAQQGLVNQQTYFKKSVAANDLSGYYLLHKGDFAYNKSYSAGYPMGAIKALRKYAEGVVSTLYICFRAKESTNPEFFEKLFDSRLQNREIAQIAQEGARNHGLLNIAVDDFFGIPLPVPCEGEQQKIADFLTALDDRIKLEESKLEQARNFKKSLLQQMFV